MNIEKLRALNVRRSTKIDIHGYPSVIFHVGTRDYDTVYNMIAEHDNRICNLCECVGTCIYNNDVDYCVKCVDVIGQIMWLKNSTNPFSKLIVTRELYWIIAQYYSKCVCNYQTGYYDFYSYLSTYLSEQFIAYNALTITDVFSREHTTRLMLIKHVLLVRHLGDIWPDIWYCYLFGDSLFCPEIVDAVFA